MDITIISQMNGGYWKVFFIYVYGKLDHIRQHSCSHWNFFEFDQSNG